MSQISELDFLKTLDDSLEQMAPEARGRVLAWANAKYGSSVSNGAATSHPPPPAETRHAHPAAAAPESPKLKKQRAKKTVPKIIKDLSLNPSGKQSFREFIAVKRPVNLLEKCTVAVYYLSNVLELVDISVDHVFTAFKGAEWRLPNDLANTLQQAGTKGWLDTRKSTGLKVTPIGENLIEHDLPRAGGAATA